MSDKSRSGYAQAFTEDEISDLWETHAMDNPACDTCRWLATITDLGAPGGAHRIASLTNHRLTGETLRKAIAAASDLTNPRLSEIEWNDVAVALSEPDPTLYDGRADTPEESRRIAEALGEHRRRSS